MDTEPLRILGVHGVGNHLPGTADEEAAEIIGRRWQTELESVLGQPAVDLRLAYYAPALDQTAGSQSVLTLDDLDPEAADMLLQWVGALGAPLGVSQGIATAPLRQAVEWVARRFGLGADLVSRFVTRFFSEVATFFGDENARQRVLATVRQELTAHRPAVVLAHSLGTVVAYEALSTGVLESVDLFITLGSPLAMPDVVFQRLSPTPVEGRAHGPDCVQRWINIADIGDLVAVPRELAAAFPRVNADERTTLGIFSFHSVRHYLACAPLVAALQSMPVSEE